MFAQSLRGLLAVFKQSVPVLSAADSSGMLRDLPRLQTKKKLKPWESVWRPNARREISEDYPGDLSLLLHFLYYSLDNILDRDWNINKLQTKKVAVAQNCENDSKRAWPPRFHVENRNFSLIELLLRWPTSPNFNFLKYKKVCYNFNIDSLWSQKNAIHVVMRFCVNRTDRYQTPVTFY